MGIGIIDNFNVNAKKPIDSRFGPYESPDEAKNSIDINTQRYQGLVVLITGSSYLTDGRPTEYWFQNGIDDNDLVVKPGGSSSTNPNPNPTSGIFSPTGSYYSTTNDLKITGSLDVTDTVDISLPSGSAFTIHEDDFVNPTSQTPDQQNRLDFYFDQGNPKLEISGRYSTSSLSLKTDQAGHELILRSNGTISRTIQGSTDGNGDLIVYGVEFTSQFKPIDTSGLVDLGYKNRRWGNLWLNYGNKISFGPNTAQESKQQLNLIHTKDTSKLTITGSNDVELDIRGNISASGNIKFTTTKDLTIPNIALYDTSSGELFYAPSSTFGGNNNNNVGIFSPTGSYYSTTNDLKITGSLVISGSGGSIANSPIAFTTLKGGISTTGTLYIGQGENINRTTARLMLGTTNNSMDIARMEDSFLQIGGVTQNYGWRIFGIKHGLNGSTFTTEIDNLIATGSLKVSGSINIDLPSGSAFTIKESDFSNPHDGRLDFSFDDGDPTLLIQSRFVQTINDGQVLNKANVAKLVLSANEGETHNTLIQSDGQVFASGPATGYTGSIQFLQGGIEAVTTTTDSAPDPFIGTDTRPFKYYYMSGQGGQFISNTLYNKVSFILNSSATAYQRGDGKYNQVSGMRLIVSGSPVPSDSAGDGYLRHPNNVYFQIQDNSTGIGNDSSIPFRIAKSGSLAINLNQSKGTGFLEYGVPDSMVHVEAEPNFGLSLFRGDNTNGDKIFEVNASGAMDVNGSIRSNFTSCNFEYNNNQITEITKSFSTGNTEKTEITYTGENPSTINVIGTDGVSTLYTIEYNGNNISGITVT